LKEKEKHNGIEYVPVDFDPFGEGGDVSAPTTEAQREIFSNIRFGGKPANCAYNESVSLLLNGPFSGSAFIGACRSLVDRHEALRCSFSDDGTEVRVSDSVDFDVTVLDLSNRNEVDRQAILVKVLDEEAETEFDVINGPLFRFRLLKLNKTEHRIILTFHHLVCDGWSLGILMQDLGHLYSLLMGSSANELKQAPSFIFANLREVEFQGSDEIKKVEQFWLDLYAGELPVMELEIDKKRPPVRTYNASRIDLSVPEELVASVRDLGIQNRTSYISTLIALFECYLSRITGTDDITLGLPSAGQAILEEQRLVGHYVNMLPLRS
jgi:hypothetical protein